MKRPAHGAFNGKGGSSSSSFAKLCGGSFRVGSGISPQKTRTFFKKIKNFQKKITAFLKKNKSFFKRLDLFTLHEMPGTLRSHSIEIQTLYVHFFFSKSQKTSYFTSSRNIL